MASPLPLLHQLADRTADFIRHAGITQFQLCEYLSISSSSLSQFLAGTKGLDPGTLIKLCQTLGLSRPEIESKFSAPIRSKILHLQNSTQGQPARMTMDDSGGSWVPGLVGIDPSIAGTIIDPPDDGHNIDADLNMLRKVRRIHREASRLINDFINSAKRGKVNRDGITLPTSQEFSQ